VQALSPVTSSPVTSFVFSHTLDAPRDLVWRAFTDPERMKQWWGPKGFPVVSSSMDLRPGGMCHYAMSVPDGSLMWGKIAYREIVAPERLVFINGFSNANGDFARHPMVPAWPLEVLSVFRFTEHEGRTTFTLEWTPINATDEECALFDCSHEGMTQGWVGTLEQLDDYLANG
jgi:uncharacterized protein YndB with AHSA1/START domain